MVWVATALIGVVPLVLVILSLMSCRAPELGVVAGRLKPCPESPNCVCSQDSDAGPAIDPIAFSGSADDALRCLKRVLAEYPRTKIIDEAPGYLRAESRSALFRFVDDLEFLVDAEASEIHVRSAARVGYSDLGANRKRVEAIREAFRKAE